jgi:hypothetical protein
VNAVKYRLPTHQLSAPWEGEFSKLRFANYLLICLYCQTNPVPINGDHFFNKGDPAMTDDLVLEPECKQITRFIERLLAS